MATKTKDLNENLKAGIAGNKQERKGMDVHDNKLKDLADVFQKRESHDSTKLVSISEGSKIVEQVFSREAMASIPDCSLNR